MKIILLQDIKGFGKKYDIKEAKDGYARNFLIPQKLAKIATNQAVKELGVQKAEWERKEKEIKAELEKTAKELEGREFKFEVKTGKKGEVFGSVGSEDIKKSLIEKGIKAEILLERPLKTLGEHQVEIDLGGGIKTKIKIISHSQL